MNPKISVIILVYQTESYIKRCAKSLFEQTLNEIEYIFVNDCTKDKSIERLKEVVKDYPQREPYVKILNLEQNRGQAFARQYGIKHATGDYIIHCDSDDWITPDMYETQEQERNVEEKAVVLQENQKQDTPENDQNQNVKQESSQQITEIFNQPQDMD